MRTLGSLAVLAAALSPAMFAQARGGARPGPRRGVAGRPAPAPPRATGPVSRPVTPAVALVPVGFFGYYADPLYYGSGYADPNAVPPPPPPDGAPPPAYYGADPSGQGYPSVLINPNYAPDRANPVIRDYAFPSSDDGSAQPSTAPRVLFLIAMKDHTIYPAIAYWVQDDTLNYITEQGVRNRVSLGLVDRDFSVRLNKERNIDFALPDPKIN